MKGVPRVATGCVKSKPIPKTGTPPFQAISRPKPSADSCNERCPREDGCVRIFWTFLFLGALSGIAAEPSPAPKVKTYIGGWGKGSGSGTSLAAPSKLDGLTPDQLKKKADLAKPLQVSLVGIGRKIAGLADISERVVDVRLTNPNPYPVFFRGRHYRDNTTINPTWSKWENGKWTPAGWDWCSRNTRDWEIAPGASLDVMFTLHPELTNQQVLGTFYKSDEPSVRSECVLYERK